MAAIFYWVLNMSVLAAVCALPLLAIQRIRAIPRRLTWVLWWIPVLRMLVPVSLSSRFSILSLLGGHIVKTVPVHSGGFVSMANAFRQVTGYFPLNFSTPFLERVFTIAGVVWLGGVALLVLSFTVIYALTMRSARRAQHYRENLYLSQAVKEPGVYGIVRPRILLPACWAEEELTFLLAHENAHIRRRDNLWRLVALLAAAVHWFNPLAWLTLREFLTQMELACDEQVLATLGQEQKKAYAASLLSAQEQKNLFSSAFGGGKLQQRVVRILSYRSISVASIAAFAVFAGVLAFALLTNGR